MLPVVSALLTFVASLLRSRISLSLENVALQHQQITDPDGDDGDAWLHRLALLQADHQNGATRVVYGVPMGTWRGLRALP
jgi:hypothetical protein